MAQKYKTKSERNNELNRELKNKNPLLLLLITLAPVVIFILQKIFELNTFSLILLGAGALVVIYLVSQWLKMKQN